MPTTVDSSAIWARFTLTRRVLRTVAAGLAGIDVLAVKGVVTSGWLYDDPGERPLSDLDIRVRPGDLGALLRAAERCGWRLQRRIRSYGSVILDVQGLAVDVESRLGPPGVSTLSIDTLLARAVRDDDGFWVPDAHDHAILLTVNVFKDKISVAMPWALEDVARVVNAPGVDADHYVARAREARVEGVAWLVADWMTRKRQHATWQSIRELLGGDSPAREVYTSIMRHLQAHADPMSLGMRVLTRLACDDGMLWPSALLRSLGAEVEQRWHERQGGPS
jgi:hypothetical protein